MSKDYKVVVLLSGGVDSTTCLAIANSLHKKEDITAINIFYGQRHVKEMEAAKAVSNYYGVEMIEIDLSYIFARSDCSLLKHSGKEIEHGSYAEQQNGIEGPVSTYVPFRNGLMLSAAAVIAMSIGAKEVWYGAHADDAAGNAYPDCSNKFVKSMGDAIYEGTAGNVKIIAPLVFFNKTAVVKEGLRLQAPYELTWSCYEGGERPCGKCATCIDREKAFKNNGVKDPAMKER